MCRVNLKLYANEPPHEWTINSCESFGIAFINTLAPIHSQNEAVYVCSAQPKMSQQKQYFRQSGYTLVKKLPTLSQFNLANWPTLAGCFECSTKEFVTSFHNTCSWIRSWVICCCGVSWVLSKTLNVWGNIMSLWRFWLMRYWCFFWSYLPLPWNYLIKFWYELFAFSLFKDHELRKMRTLRKKPELMPE